MTELLLGTTSPSSALLRAALDPDDDVEPDEVEQARRELIAAIRAGEPTAIPPEEWAELVSDLDDHISEPVGEIPQILRRHRPPEAVSDELDELSLAAMVELDTHGAGVAAQAKAIASQLGLPHGLANAVEQAARFHDLGKADSRFQRWLDPTGRSSAPVAKSDRPRDRWRADRIAAGWPQGGRHEELSRRLVSTWINDTHPEDADLLQHLVVTHHGQGRPLILPVDDDTSSMVEASIDGARLEAKADLGTIDWGQPARFRSLCAHHGLWGLALLEAIVRQADHQVSGGTAQHLEVL